MEKRLSKAKCISKIISEQWFNAFLILFLMFSGFFLMILINTRALGYSPLFSVCNSEKLFEVILKGACAK